MTLFRLEMTSESRAKFTQRMDRLERAGERLPDAVREHVGPVLAHIFDRNFEAEGPGWAALSEGWTVPERESLGFPGRHPILQRSGSLRASVGDRGHPQHVEDIVPMGDGSFRLEVGSSDIRAGMLGRGGVTGLGTVIPARPFLQVDEIDHPLLREALRQAARTALGLG